MKNRNQFKKIFSFLTLGCILLGATYFSFTLLTPSARAENNYVQDSDYDGLSDQVEREVYKTEVLQADTDSDGLYDAAEVLLGSDPLSKDINNVPEVALVSAASETNLSIPWYTSRAAGITAYVLMFLVVILGTGMTTAYAYKLFNPTQAWVIHKYLSMALGLTLLVHIFSLLFDKYINFGFTDIFIPFSSDFKTLYLSLGIFAFYILLIIIFTSLWFRLRYQRAWRGVHYTVYPLFIFSLIHGLLIGTDSQTLGMQIVYWSTGLIYVSLLIYRFGIYISKQRRK